MFQISSEHRQSVPPILATRLVLNLHHIANQPGGTSVPTTQSRVSGLVFATNTILGNIGAPLRVGEAEEDDDIAEAWHDPIEVSHM